MDAVTVPSLDQRERGVYGTVKSDAAVVSRATINDRNTMVSCERSIIRK
jgi:hypothetical protein